MFSLPTPDQETRCRPATKFQTQSRLKPPTVGWFWRKLEVDNGEHEYALTESQLILNSAPYMIDVKIDFQRKKEKDEHV